MSSSGFIKVCPYECPDFYRLGSCVHEQKVRQPKVQQQQQQQRKSVSPSSNSNAKRRGSLPALWSTLIASSPPISRPSSRKLDTSPATSSKFNLNDSRRSTRTDLPYQLQIGLWHAPMMIYWTFTLN